MQLSDDELRLIQSALAWKGMPDRQPAEDRRLHRRIAREINQRAQRRKEVAKFPRILVTQDVRNCARCGKNHKEVEFLKFRRPLQLPSGLEPIPTHFGFCPGNGEPILLAIVKTDDTKDDS